MKYKCRCPDTASVKQKMLYSGSKGSISDALVGVTVKINATDRSELSRPILDAACAKFS